MGGGGSGKTSTSTQSSPYATLLANWSDRLMKTWMPVQNQLASQTGEALKTGGVNAQIPIISRAVDAARQGATQTEEQTRQSLARSGTSGPEAQAILGEERMAEGDRIAGIGPGIASQFISQAPQMSQAGIGQAFSGAGQAMWGNMTTTSTPSFWDFFIRGLAASQGSGSGGSAGQIGAAMAP